MVHYKIEKLLKIPQHEQRSPEWFAMRKTKLTSVTRRLFLVHVHIINHINFYLKNADMTLNHLLEMSQHFMVKNMKIQQLNSIVELPEEKIIILVVLHTQMFIQSLKIIILYMIF